MTAGPDARVDEDALYAAAVSFVLQSGKPSPNRLHRHFGIAYSAAYRLVERMEREAIVSPPDGEGRRHVRWGARIDIPFPGD